MWKRAENMWKQAEKIEEMSRKNVELDLKKCVNRPVEFRFGPFL